MPMVNISEILLFFICTIFLAFPGYIIVNCWFRTWDQTEKIILGILFGFALQIVPLTIIGHWRISLQWLVICLIYVFIIRLWFLGKNLPRDPKKTPIQNPSLFLILAIQFLFLLSTIYWNIFPHGTDAVYHVGIAQKFLNTGKFPNNFLPFDPTPPNYPPGSHLFTVWLAILSGIQVHRLYQLLMVFFILLNTCLIYSLGKIWKGTKVGIFSAVCFAFMTNWGSLDLIRWGSLPNLIGTTYFLSAFLLTFKERKKNSLIILGMLLSAMIVSHHLTSLIFGFLYLSLGIWIFKKEIAFRSEWFNLTKGLGIGIILSSVYLFSFLKDIFSRLTTPIPSAGEHASKIGYLNVVEPPLLPWDLPLLLGPFLILFAIIGIYSFKKEKPSKNTLGGVFLFWAIVTGGFYFILDWPIRFVIRWVFELDIAIFTPSRFLTHIVYPLSIFGGYGVLWLFQRQKWLQKTAVFASLFYALWILSPLWKPITSQNEWEGMIWFQKNTPPHSLLLQNPLWAPYVTHREGTRMVLRQEILSGYTAQKRKLTSQGITAIHSWMEKYNRPVYLWLKKPLKSPFSRLIWHRGDQYIYRILKSQTE